MNKKKTELTVQEMTAARMFSEDSKASARTVAEKLGMNYRTLARYTLKPQFQEYMAKIRAEQDAALKKQTEQAVKKIDFGLADGIAVLAKLAQLDPDTSRFTGQVKAIEVLAKMLRWVPQDGEFSSKPVEPDVYQAEWMRKPQ